MISTTLDQDGGIIHKGDLQSLVLGPLTKLPALEPKKVLAALTEASFEVCTSDWIEQEVWQKCEFIALSAGITTHMRVSVLDIVG